MTVYLQFTDLSGKLHEVSASSVFTSVDETGTLDTAAGEMQIMTFDTEESGPLRLAMPDDCTSDWTFVGSRIE